MAKKSKTTTQKNIRWKMSEDLHAKIATYQKSHKLRSMNIAGVILLEKVTQDIKPIEINIKSSDL